MTDTLRKKWIISNKQLDKLVLNCYRISTAAYLSLIPEFTFDNYFNKHYGKSLLCLLIYVLLVLTWKLAEEVASFICNFVMRFQENEAQAQASQSQVIIPILQFQENEAQAQQQVIIAIQTTLQAATQPTLQAIVPQEPELQYCKLKNTELKGLCKSKGLKQNGNRADLVACLIQYDTLQNTTMQQDVYGN